MSPRISYVQPSTVTDEEMLAEFDRCAREGTPRPESQAIRAHVPAVFWSFANSWRTCSRTASPTMPSRSSAASTCRARCCASSAATSARSRPPRPARSKTTTGPDQFRILHALQRQAEGRARLCGGDHLGPADRRRVLGAAAQALQRAGAGRDRLFHRARPWASSAGCARSNIEHHQMLAGTDARWRRASRPMDALKPSKAQADYWAKKPAQPQAAE